MDQQIVARMVANEIVCNTTRTDDTMTMPEIILVEGGSFHMGGYVRDSEEPLHRVVLDTYYIGKYPITVGQYRAFCAITGKSMPTVDNGWAGSEHVPVVNVTYGDAVYYCDWLSENYGRGWRLPTEAEWEYAARGGCRSKGYIYSGSDDLSVVGWFAGNANGRPVIVGRKQANELGIYDMSGNIWEWCKDWYDTEYYTSSPISNPQGPPSGTCRVLRGGAYDDIPLTCRVAHRSSHTPGTAHRINSGFRVVFSL